MYLMQKHHEQDVHIRAQIFLTDKLFIVIIKLMNFTTTLTNPIFSSTTNLHLDHLKIQKPIVLVGGFVHRLVCFIVVF